jgi:hypothetical protein
MDPVRHPPVPMMRINGGSACCEAPRVQPDRTLARGSLLSRRHTSPLRNSGMFRYRDVGEIEAVHVGRH